MEKSKVMINFELEYGGIEKEEKKKQKKRKKWEESEDGKLKILCFPLGLSYMAFYFDFTWENLHNPLENNWASIQSCVDLGLLKPPPTGKEKLQTVGHNLFIWF